LLSNQRPWGAIACHLPDIDEIFFGYDADLIKKTESARFVASLRKIQCGNRRIKTQMDALRMNIETFERIVTDYGSLDIFVNSARPNLIAAQLSISGGRYKLKEVGFTLAMEYLRNVGVHASKPDVHVQRILSSERLGLMQGTPTPEKAYDLMETLAADAGVNSTYLDNLLWIFCARDYGNICGATPNCAICRLSELCNYPKSGSPRSVASRQ
jgi:hypothetical protein